MQGPPETLYEGETFALRFRFVRDSSCLMSTPNEADGDGPGLCTVVPVSDRQP